MVISKRDLRTIRMNEVDTLTQFCHELLATLPRSDQRRWGEIYVRGLVSLAGRKSIRRMAETMAGWRAEQGLQQFVNQSTWSWGPIRQNLARHLGQLYRPKAWAIGEAVFAKNGTSSVGVARQFAPSAGRLLNCQLGLALFVVGDGEAVPVNWRLLLPQSWDHDADLRAKAHIPDSARHVQRWQAVLSLVDELAWGWELPPQPVVVDARHVMQTEQLLAGLEQRRMRYLVQVPHESAAPLFGGEQGPRPGGVGRPVATMKWWDAANGRQRTSRYMIEAAPARRGGEPAGLHRTRKLLTRWQPEDSHPAQVWLTNMHAPMPELIELSQAGAETARETSRLYDDVGLDHFEGRSFRGWHHHVTLTSLAHAYLVSLRRAELGCDLRSC
ncbi:IS701 family transposase [Lentzea alba]|uniref:IS701 family transposase n=1 Tax=Lentzea alba TaxID=2714351 RepID=UPI0039BF5CC6